MMKTSHIMRILGGIAPTSIAANWDNSGWQIKQESSEVSGVLLTIDVTATVIDEAVRTGANLVISHHPLFFDPVKVLDLSTPKGRVAAKAMQQKVSIFSMHSNLDVCPEGTSFALAERLGLTEVKFLSPLRIHAPFDVGWGAIGKFSQSLSLSALRDLLVERLGTASVRTITADGSQTLRAVALGPGSLSNLISDVLAQSIRVYVTSDLKYHDGLDALENGLSILDVDHYYAERPVLDKLRRILEPQLEVQVTVSQVATSPFAGSSSAQE
jgi:GTP cyclohydrolase I